VHHIELNLCQNLARKLILEYPRRIAYQVGHVWAQTVPNLPSPGEWQWLHVQVCQWRLGS